MTAASSDLTLDPIVPAWLRRWFVAPAEGWLTLGFVILMALTVAWSLDDAAWVLGRSEWGDFYAWGAILAVLVGFAGAKVGWPRWLTHVIGAVTAALVLPIMVGSILLPDGGSPGEFFRATADSATKAWIDFAILDRTVTSQTGHHLVAIGILAWSVGQFAGYAVFGHRRPLDAVLVVGIVLLGNMAITPNDQLWYLVAFSIAGLAVLARTHAFDEQATWVRRRIGDPAAVRGLYLRGGAVFIAAAVFGALALTASASSNPLAGAWRGFDRQLIAWGREMQRFLPFGGATRVGGFGFANSAPIHGKWVSDSRLAVTIRLEPGEIEKFYWRAVAFDRFDLNAWTWSEPGGLARAAGEPILEGTAEAATDAFGRREVQYRVELNTALGGYAFSPQDPLTVDQPTRVQAVGNGLWFGALEVDADAYQVTAGVPLRGEDDNGLTANRLRAAGEDYPDEVRSVYVPLPTGSLGVHGRELLDDIKAGLGEDATPYDLALAIEGRLKNGREFRYQDDIGSLCDGMSAAECFAQFKRGYCLHYASTMAVMLRSEGIPARLVLGYLPGDRDVVTGEELVRASGAHAWVEVWFPGFGWYMFDPTGGLSQTVPLVPGPAVTPAPTTPGTPVPLPSRDDEGLEVGRPGGPVTSRDGAGSGGPRPEILAVLAVLLLVLVGAAVSTAWYRGPRGDVTADGVWRGIARTAARFGFGPRPQQTVYEYAAVLGDVLPDSRPELQTVARAKVEVAYGRRELGQDTLRSLREAQRRLRITLLRLAFRRLGGRPRLRRPRFRRPG